MTFIVYILFYLSLGFLWAGVLELVNKYTQSLDSFSIPFIVVTTLFWPISFFLFTLTFIRYTFFGDD